MSTEDGNFLAISKYGQTPTNQQAAWVINVPAGNRKEFLVSYSDFWRVFIKLTHPARENGDFVRNCLPIPAVFVRNLWGKTQAWYPILDFCPFHHYLCRNSQAWYPVLHCTSPFFSNHMFMDSTYFLLILFWSCLAGHGHVCGISVDIEPMSSLLMCQKVQRSKEKNIVPPLLCSSLANSLSCLSLML